MNENKEPDELYNGNSKAGRIRDERNIAWNNKPGTILNKRACSCIPTKIIEYPVLSK